LSDLYEFPNLIMTSVFFFLITLVLFAASKVGIFTIVRVPVIEMIPIAIAYSTMIVLDCLSIEYNARGTHELLKTFTLPLILLLTTMFYKFNYSLKLKLVLIPLFLGMFSLTKSDLDFNLAGVCFALISAFMNAVYLVLLQEKMKETNMNPFQMLIYQAPLSSLLLAMAIPFYESSYSFYTVIDLQKSFLEWLGILGVGALFFVITFCFYSIVSLSTSLTYNVFWVFEFAIFSQFPSLFGPIYMGSSSEGFDHYLGILLISIGLYGYYKYQHEVKFDSSRYVLMSNKHEKSDIFSGKA